MSQDKSSKKTSKEIADMEEQLYSYDGEDQIVSSHKIAEELKNQPETLVLLTQIDGLDSLLDGVEPGELIVITGPSGEGKTTLMMTITKNMASQEIQSVWFTLEVTPKQFIQKISNKDETVPLFYMPRKNVDNKIDWLENRIVEATVKYDTRVVFIDHLHMIFNLFHVKTNTSLEIGQLADHLKSIALRHNLVLFLVVHNKNNTMQPNAEIRKEDIRDSGLIERTADSILGIWRIQTGDTEPKKRPNNLTSDDNWAKLKVLKNRREGKLGYVIMEHHNHHLIGIDPKQYLDEEF